ncbi:hypothetical protein Y919_09370 [Caloranaerobacter azorensis H53214]|uniref:Mur ligase central domain-containing protein n=1 Tax=Caloranaerobacter azorensis H53214 TaxID=1156417 RepID=A0A096BGI8_9FIRM|nr:Mur ligase family protein [Caloranaerobacter azorensis]KGG79873.1 hypothetical protein Y919_09370 [Caloranaerobacter azorensis H53214]
MSNDKKVGNIVSKLKETKEDYHNFIYENVLFIGVTGIQSKMTISLIEHILKYAGLKTKILQANFNDLNAENIDIIDDIFKNGTDIVIIEVFPKILDFIYNFKFDIAVHTSIENSYPEDFFKIQKELFCKLDRGKIAIINIDDNNALRLIEDNNSALVVTYGLNNKASLTASSISITDYINLVVCLQRSLTTIQGVDIGTLEFPITLKSLAENNIYSALASIAVVLSLNVDIEIIKKSIASFDFNLKSIIK